MATSLQNKINELEARLKAENEVRANDPLPRNLVTDSPGLRRPLPCKTNRTVNASITNRVTLKNIFL